jgi:hypothetical protein
MKRLLIVVAATVLLAASCNDDDPAAPNPNPEPEASPYSGTFNVTFDLQQSDCQFPPPLDQLRNITVSEDDFDWGGMKGTWDEDEKRGYGTSAETCIPIPQPAGCVGCYVVQFDVTFANPDSFYGEVIVPYDYNDVCNATDCSSTYDVTGTRAQ